MKNLILVLVAISMIGCSTPSTVSRNITDHACNNIIDIFRSAGYDVGVPEVTQCFQTENTDDATINGLLRLHGFEVYRKSRDEDPEYFLSATVNKNIEPDDDVYIYAYRINEFFNIRPSRYELHVYLKDDVVSRVYANKKHAYPPL